jgi:hypothetical protein
MGGATQRELVQRWRWFVMAWLEATPADRASLLASKVIRLLQPRNGRGLAPRPASAPDDRDGLIRTYMGAAADYVPLPYDGRIVVFWPVDDPEPASDALKWWRRISPRAEVETIPGDHLTAVTLPGLSFARRRAARLGA